jgi:hypothetical protein
LNELIQQSLLSLNPPVIELALTLVRRPADQEFIVPDDLLASANEDIPNVTHGVPPTRESSTGVFGNAEWIRKVRSRQRRDRGLFLLQAPFDELALDVRQLGIQLSAIAMDIVPVRAEAGEVLVEHRHS